MIGYQLIEPGTGQATEICVCGYRGPKHALLRFDTDEGGAVEKGAVAYLVFRGCWSCTTGRLKKLRGETA